MSLPDLQYTVDEAGNRTAVIIPIERWNEIQVILGNAERQKSEMSARLKTAFKEMQDIEKGIVEPVSVQQLFDKI